VAGATPVSAQAGVGAVDARLGPADRTLWVDESKANEIGVIAVNGANLTELPSTPLPAGAAPASSLPDKSARPNSREPLGSRLWRVRRQGVREWDLGAIVIGGRHHRRDKLPDGMGRRNPQCRRPGEASPFHGRRARRSSLDMDPLRGFPR
jgi:hypothetical protein